MLEVTAAETPSLPPPNHGSSGSFWALEAGGISVALKIERVPPPTAPPESHIGRSQVLGWVSSCCQGHCD